MFCIAEFLSAAWTEALLTQAQLWLTVYSLDTLRYLIGVGLVCSVLYGLLGAWSESRRIQSRRASRRDIRREISYSLLTTAQSTPPLPCLPWRPCSGAGCRPTNG